MTDECPACGAELDAWAEIALEADDAVMAIGRRIFETRDKWDIEFSDFLEALMAGLLTGTVAVGFTISPSHNEVMEYLRGYLDTARQNYEISRSMAEEESNGGTLQ